MTQLAPELRHTPPPQKSKAARIWGAAQVILSLAVTVAFVIYLSRAPSAERKTEEVVKSLSNDVVRPAGMQLVFVQPGHPFEKKLQSTTVQNKQVSVPLAKVTGTVVASLRPGRENAPPEWQFQDPDSLTNYTEWQKARHDIEFHQKRLAAVRNSVEAQVKFLASVEESAKKGEAQGAQSLQNLRKAVMEKRKAELDGARDIYDAETALWLAQRAKISEELQLEQAGIESELLETATPDMDIVMADVPVSVQSRVRISQKCEARFFGIPGQVFTGKVNSIVQVMSKERRSLRVLFVIHDPDDQLRPGMFAEINLGIDPREALMAPIDGIVHVGRSDYLLVATDEPGIWRASEVRTGESRGHEIEILEGVDAGNTVIGEGAVLLKPVIVRALQIGPNASVPQGKK